MSKIITYVIVAFLFSAFLQASDFENDLKKLTTNSYSAKQKIVAELVEKYPHEKELLPTLGAMLGGRLYYTKKEKKFVIVKQKNGSEYQVYSPAEPAKTTPIKKSQIKKVKTNNRLRSFIREKLAEMSLFALDNETRLKSAKNILKHLSRDSIPLIEKALQTEKDPGVLEVLKEAHWILLAKYGNVREQLAAVKSLRAYLSPEALHTLKEIAAISKDERIKKEAEKSIASIKEKKTFYSIVERFFFGLSLGSILLLAAIGLAITFGVMKVINMAHGELMMIGAYTTFTLQQIMPNLIGYSVLLAIPLAFLVSGIVGIVIERTVIRHLYGRPLETLLATFGISLILQQLARTIYSPLNQEVKTPEWMSGSLEINGALSLTYNRLYIILFAMLVFVAVLLLLKKTSLGLKVRAVTQNRVMAQAMGIKTGVIDALTFGIGSGIAGVGGVALSQLTNVGPNLGQAYIVDSFMVVVFGGVGNLWGTLVASITLGEISKFIEPIYGAVLAKVIILAFIILFIQKRPRGLFPQKGRDIEE
jgi:urea transport system permease protein